MNRFACLAVGLLLVGSNVPSFAATKEIALSQFFQKDAGQRLFHDRNEGKHVVGGVTGFTPSQTLVDPGSMPASFLLRAGDLPLDLSTRQDTGIPIDLPLTSYTIRVARTEPSDQGLDARIGALTATFSNAELDGSQDGRAFAITNNDDSVITYTSDFLEFGSVVGAGFAFSFSGASSEFAVASGSTVLSAHSSGPSPSASDPARLMMGLPGASIWITLSLSFGTVGVMMRTGRRQRDLYAAQASVR